MAIELEECFLTRKTFDNRLTCLILFKSNGIRLGKSIINKCVNFEFELWLPLMLCLRPCSLDPIETFKIRGQDINVNLVFCEFLCQMNHLVTKSMCKVYENL